MGLSLGGYGALKCALKYPGSMPDSGVFSRLHFAGSRKYLGDQMDYTELQAIWGMNLEKMEENDVQVQ